MISDNNAKKQELLRPPSSDSSTESNNLRDIIGQLEKLLPPPRNCIRYNYKMSKWSAGQKVKHKSRFKTLRIVAQ